MNRLIGACVALGFGITALLAGAPALAQEAQAQPPVTQTKWVQPLKGVADILVLPTDTKVKGNEVVTTITAKNVSTGAIALFTVEEFWWNGNEMVPGGDRQRVKKLWMPGEVITVTCTALKSPSMKRNTYQFSHANGTIKAKQVKKF